MLDDGLQPTAITYTAIIGGFILLNKIQEAESVFKLMEDHGVSPDVVSYSALINGYCKCGKTERALANAKDYVK